MIPLSLYIHFPWCIRKCPYCDFNSHEVQGDVPEQAYIKALEADLINDLHFVQGRKIHSIFMGGGTPSLFSSEAMASLFEMLQRHLVFETDIEITLEANPGTTDYGKFSGYHKAGINRLSMGVQSFSNKQLNLLGRIHDNNDVFSAFDAARNAGFDNINLDLMHGLEKQSLSEALSDLNCAIELQPEHISWYQLTIEQNTQFYKTQPTLPNDDQLWQIYLEGSALLSSENYARYEVSAFSQANRQSRHNVNYWQFGDYLGIGAGAHGKITLEDQYLRTRKTRLPRDYLKQQKTLQHPKKTLQHPIAQDDLTLEFLMNTLRLVDGFSLHSFTARTGQPQQALDEFIETALSKELIQLHLEQGQQQIKPTDKGLQFLNELLLLAL